MMRRAWPALVLAVAACDSAQPSPTPAPAPGVVPPTPAPSVSPPAAEGREIECAASEAHVLTTMSAGPGDLVVGSIKWPGLRTWATANPKDFGDPATGDYKIGAEVRAGATVTVSVAGSGARLNYGQDRQYSPTGTVTFHACANGDTAYIGGFHVKAPGCVPLDIAEGGRPPARVTVSFFAGACRGA